MIKRLYTLFSVLLLLASCATEEIEQIEIQPTDGSMVSLSFSVDAPNALEITKATGDVEKGVESYIYIRLRRTESYISSRKGRGFWQWIYGYYLKRNPYHPFCRQ